MGKLVLKTAAATVSFLVAFALILFGIVSLASPSAMMSFTDSLGMRGASAYYSIAAYDRSGEISDLAIAVERSSDAGHYSDAAEYGKKLLNHADFAEYCAARDADTQGNISFIRGSYAQYAAGLVSTAQYYSGEKTAARDTALGSLEENTFPQNNAVIYLASAAMDSGDTELCKDILSALENLSVENVQEQEYFQSFIADLRAYCAQ